MKGNFPDPPEFSVSTLAKDWGLSVETINCYINYGMLKVEMKAVNPNAPKWMNSLIDRRYITLKEVLRFKSEYGIDNSVSGIESPLATSLISPFSKLPPNEKPEDYVARRLKDGISDPEIALELREKEVYWSTIGRIFFPDESSITNKTSSAKRAKSLIRKLNKSFNERIKSVFSEKEFLEWLGKK